MAAEITKNCNQSETIIALPLAAAQPYDVVGMALNEPHCLGTKNQTHWVLKTQSTSCGSVNFFEGGYPMLSNSVHLKFSSESKLKGLEVRLPFTCKFRPGFMGLANNGAGNEDAEDDMIDHDYEDREEMYKMKILRRSGSGDYQVVVDDKDDDDGVVQLGDELKIVTEFDTRSPLLLSIDRCWILDHDRTNSEAISDNLWLIWKGCPPKNNVNNVTLLPTRSPSFSFNVQIQHVRMRRFYVFCLIGLCSSEPAFAKGNIGLCPERESRCLPDAAEHVLPVAQQMTKRGPIMVKGPEHDDGDASGGIPDLQVLKDYKENTAKEGDSSSNQSPPSLHSSHVVMVGVPAEIAIAIAIASFVIGAALTGMLCCVLHRQRPPKMVRNLSTS